MPFSAAKVATMFFVIGWVTWSLYVAVITQEAINNYFSVGVVPGGQPSEIFAPPATIELSDSLQSVIALISILCMTFAVVISLDIGSQYLFSILSGVMLVGTYIFYEPMISYGVKQDGDFWILGILFVTLTIIRMAVDQMRALKASKSSGDPS